MCGHAVCLSIKLCIFIKCWGTNSYCFYMIFILETKVPTLLHFSIDEFENYGAYLLGQ